MGVYLHDATLEPICLDPKMGLFCFSVLWTES